MFPVKKLLLLVFSCCLFIVSLAQSGKDTIPVKEQHDTPGVKKDTAAKPLPDTSAVTTTPEAVDSTMAEKPPVVTARPDTEIPVASVIKGPAMPEPQPSMEGFHN